MRDIDARDAYSIACVVDTFRSPLFCIQQDDLYVHRNTRRSVHLLYTLGRTHGKYISFAARTAPAVVVSALIVLAQSPKAPQMAEAVSLFPLAFGFCGSAP